MITFCHFDAFLRNSADEAERVAIIFTAAESFHFKSAAEELKEVFADAFVPQRTIFIGFKYNLEYLRSLLESDELKHIHLPFLPNEADLYFFGAEGRLLNSKTNDSLVPAIEENFIRRQGMTSIFTTRGGIMNSGQSYHYVKPSGGHSKFFLRPGNIMKSGAEVAFISSWLLSKVNMFTTSIYTDTASITQVAYSLASLSKRLKIFDSEPPIQSFSSYEGIDGADSFAPQLDALILISASTSGSLRKRVIRSGASPDNVMTLFSTADDSYSLCNLSFDSATNPDGLTPFKTHSKSECPYCAAGTLAITIAGDSFLPETPEPRLKLLKRTDKPKWLSKIATSLESNNLTSCFTPMDEGKNYPIYVDLEKICNSSIKNDYFDLPLSRVTLAEIDAIVHLSDPASFELAKKSFDMFGGVADKDKMPLLIRADTHLDQKLSSLSIKRARKLSVTVIASCIAGGFSLLGVSRSLRSNASQISYFIGLALQPTQQSWEELRSNLELRNDDRGKNPIEIVWNAQMPRSASGDISSWDTELRWLSDNISYLDENSELRDRVDVLNNFSGQRTKGLVENVFLKSPNLSVLELAPNFAFHKVKKDARLSQSDVFFITLSILHGLRESKDSEGLRQSLNGPVLLSPTNFDRYNDSLLQASLLRAARPSELAYITHPSSSKSIADLMIRMITNPNSDDSGALPEFLLALCSGRMTLLNSDVKNILKKFEMVLENCDYLSAFGPSLYTIATHD